MQAQFFNYQIVDQNTLDKLQINENSVLIYDKKPENKICCSSIYDINTFKIAIWKANFNPENHEPIIFQVKKFSIDVIYCYLKCTKRKIIVFTDDSDFKDKISNNYKHNITITVFSDLNNNLPTSLQNFENFYNNIKSITQTDTYNNLYSIALLYNDYINMLVDRLNHFNKILNEYKNINKQITVFSNEDFNSIAPSSKDCVDEANSGCFVFDFDSTFDYSKFNMCYFFISEIDNIKKANVLKILTEEAFNICKTLFYNPNFEQFPCFIKYCTFDYFKDFLISDNDKILTMIVEQSIKKTDSFEFLRLDEKRVGNVTFPGICSRQLLDCVLLSLKNELERVYLFIRSIVPTIKSSIGGFLNSEFKAEVSFPGLFDYIGVSDFYITKKEAICDACYNFILKLINDKIIDNNLDPILKNILLLTSIKNLYLKSYGTFDMKIINKIREDFKLNNGFLGSGESIIEKNGEILIVKSDPFDVENAFFKKKYMIDISDLIFEEQTDINKLDGDEYMKFFFCNTPNTRLERFYRKIPDCLSKPTNNMSLYVFNNSNTGILCGESFIGSYQLINEFNEKVQISFKGSQLFNDREFKILKFYQIIFFKMHNEIYPSKERAFDFYYFVVPLKNNLIDWEYLELCYSNFLLDFSYNRKTDNTLIWNPFTHEFCLFADYVDKNIEDQIGNATFLKFFENKFRINLTQKTGNMVFKSFLTDQILAVIRKQLNIKQNENDVQRINPQDPSNYSYSICNIPDYNDIDPLKPSDFYSKVSFNNTKLLDINTLSINSLECCFTTPIRINILQEVEIFKHNYILLENLFIANEFNNNFNLNTDLRHLVMSFTQYGENHYENYERLEFLGDCVLKFLTTNFLYLSGLSMDIIVSVKDHIICNKNLFIHSIKSGLSKYLKIIHFSSKMVQAPHLNGVNEFLKYFNAHSIFKSDNYNQGLPKNINKYDQAVKQYADMVEALIGAIYLSTGISKAMEFIYTIGLIKPLDYSAKNISDPNINNSILMNIIDTSIISPNENTDDIKKTISKDISYYQDSNSHYFSSFDVISEYKSLFVNHRYKVFEYTGILTLEDIKGVENEIEYVFKNPGNLERALVHPSFTNKLGSVDFQFLELIGDSALDLFVTSLLYKNHILNTPLLLHSSKKSYVNNSALFRFFNESKLEKYVKHGLKQGIYSKAYSDFVEALIGSILVDLQWNFEEFYEVMNRKIKILLEKCKVMLTFE